jgi:hypothetical protein
VCGYYIIVFLDQSETGTISATVAGIVHAEHLRLSFEYLFTRKFIGDPIEISLLRDGVGTL